MNRSSIVTTVGLLALILLFPACSAQAQKVPDPERMTRIADNIKLQFDQLRDVPVSVTELEASGISGMDIGTLIINNQQRARFLVSSDDKQLFLLAAEAVDVSKTRQEIEQEIARMAEEELGLARQRHAELMEAAVGAPSRGPESAPVTIVEFSDFQCPYCARVVPTVEQVLEKYPEDVRVVFMHLPLNIHPWAESAAVAAACVARQSNDAFWSLHDYYFDNQGSIEPGNVMAKSRVHLGQSAVDLNAWDTCALDTGSDVHAEVLASVRASEQMAQGYGASGTPAFFINGRFLSGAQPLELFQEVIDKALAEDR